MLILSSYANTVSEIVSQKLRNSLENVKVWGNLIINVLDYGAKGDGFTDDTAAFNKAFVEARNKNSVLVVPNTGKSYRLSKFQGQVGVDVIGIDKPKIDLFFKPGVTVLPMLGFESNSKYINIYFNCLDNNKEWNRGDMARKNNISLIDCRIEGFRHASALANAWGLYIDEAKKISIIRCQFENNSQSDIAILEGCEDILIQNCYGSKFYVNFEPNDNGAIRNVVIEGSDMHRLNLIENSFIGVAIQNATVIDCEIDLVEYRGGYVKFVNSNINEFRTGFGTIHAGSVDFGGALNEGYNLIEDPLFYSIGTSASPRYWNIGISPNAGTLERKIDPVYGEVLVINPSNINTVLNMYSKQIPAIPNERFLLSLESQGRYTASSVWLSQQLMVRYYNSSNVMIKEDYVALNKAPAANGSVSNFNEETTVITCPENTSYLILHVCNTRVNATSTSSLVLKKISLRRFSYGFSTKSLNYREEKIKSSGIPVSIPAASPLNMYLKGTMIENENIVAGGNIGWVCTASGNPGTWKSYGMVEA